MRLAVDEHPIGDTDGDLANHLHQVHHIALRHLHGDLDRLELLHADDHDDLRRGIGG